MNLALAGIGCVAVGAAVLAVTSRDPRGIVLGLLVVLLAAPLLADPLPGPLPIAARLVAALLACHLVAIAVRGEAASSGGTRIGWPADLLVAVAAGLIGYGSHGLGSPGLGPAEAQAAGFAIGALAAAPLVTGRDVVRLGVGSALLVTAALLVRVGLGGTPTELEQLVTSGVVVGLGGAIAVIVVGARASRSGLDASSDVERDPASRAPGERAAVRVREPGRRRPPAGFGDGSPA